MSLRVLVVTNMYPSSRKPWFGTFVHEQVTALRAAGAHVDVLEFEDGRTHLAYATAAAEVRRRAARYDVVHAHHGLAGAIAVMQRTRPVVTTFHGSDTGRKPWQLHVSRRVARRSLPIVVEPTAAQRLRAPHARVVACGVDLDRFVPREREEARRLAGWNLAGPYLLFPASPRRSVKRHDLFEQCAAAYAARYGLVNTAVLDGVNRGRAALMMAAADAVVMTSDSEGSPVAVKESLACSTPIVSVDVGDVRRVIAGLPGCSIASREPAALAEAVRRALIAGHPAELRDRATEFGNATVAARLLDIYGEAAGR